MPYFWYTTSSIFLLLIRILNSPSSKMQVAPVSSHLPVEKGGELHTLIKPEWAPCGCRARQWGGRGALLSLALWFPEGESNIPECWWERRKSLPGYPQSWCALGAPDSSFMLERVLGSHLKGRRPSIYSRNFWNKCQETEKEKVS